VTIFDTYRKLAVGDPEGLLAERQTPPLHIREKLPADVAVFRSALPEPQGVFVPFVIDP